MRRRSLLLLLLAGCGHRGTDDTADTIDTADTGDTGDTGTTGAFAVADHVALPYVEVGDAAPHAPLAIRAPSGHGSDGALTIGTPSGPFSVTGSTDPLGAGEERALTVAFTGATDAPSLDSGAVTLVIDGEEHPVVLAAVVGDPALPSASWSADGWGSRTVVALPSAPFPADGPGPWYDPSVLLFVPSGHSPHGPVHVVTHLHGHGATLLDTIGYQRIVEQTAISGRDLLLVVPQGPVEAASGDFGQLMDPGGHARLVRDAVSVLYRDGMIWDVALGQQVLTAHSGGYLATATILDGGGLPIDAVHLFDALYARESTFEDHVLDGGLLRSVYTAGGGTADNNATLLATLEGEGVTVSTALTDEALATSRVSIAYSPSSHGNVVSDRRGYARWLAASDLPPHDLAPPELLAVERDGDEVAVQWRVDRGLTDRLVVVQGSDDGVTWRDLGTGSDGTALVPAAPWVRLVAETGATRSDPSDAYAGSGTAWLVVDGFDRVFGGSYTQPTHPFAGRVGTALPGGASTASNEAVVEGRVDPLGYDRVVWLLGDESIADDTFDADERDIVRDIVQANVPLVVSGAEIGYATSAAFLDSPLGVTYVADDAGTTHAGGYTFGVAYPEDYPDVLGGGTTLWTYDTGGAAAVVTAAGVVIGFPLETLADDDLGPALEEVAAALASR